MNEIGLTPIRVDSLDLMSSRLDEIHEIERDILELAEIQRELNRLVSVQGQELEIVDSITESAQHKIVESRKTIRKAAKSKYSRLKTKLSLSGFALGTCIAGMYTASGPIAIASGIVAGSAFGLFGKTIQKTV